MRRCDVDAADKKGATPIYVAAHMGYHDVIRLLVDLGADVNMQVNVLLKKPHDSP